MRYVICYIVLYAFWLLLTGLYDATHLILGAAATLIVTMWSAKLMFDKSPGIRHFVFLFKIPFYLVWLMWEVVKSNWIVAKLALADNVEEVISPTFFVHTTRLRSDVAKVTLANSITLTPGTITVSISGDEFHIYAITRELADGGVAGMEKWVAWLFGEKLGSAV
jgi:multicomponent Na+:H+ antiporter subunit E